MLGAGITEVVLGMRQHCVLSHPIPISPPQTLVDTHTHTYLCKHAEYIQPRAYLEIAAQRGFTNFAFCDHNPFEEDNYDFIHRMSFKEFGLFNNMYAQLRDVAASQYHVTLMKYMEVDWQVFDNSRTIDFVDKHLQDFDGVLGSIHMNDEVEKQWMDEHSVDEFLAMYREQWLAMVNSGRFQIASHPDFFRYAHQRILELDRDPAFSERINQFVIDTVLKANDLKSFILEVNTSARKKGNYVSFVAPQVAVQLAKQGVQLCVASDSHNIDQIGEGFRDMYEYFLENEVHTLYYAEHK